MKVQKYLLGTISFFELKEESIGLSSIEVGQRKTAQSNLAKVILIKRFDGDKNLELRG